MNISSIKINSTPNFVALNNIKQPEKNNYNNSSNNSNWDVFTSSTRVNKKPHEMEKHVVVTYDDVYVFETPKDTSNSGRHQNFFTRIVNAINS